MSDTPGRGPTAASGEPERGGGRRAARAPRPTRPRAAARRARAAALALVALAGCARAGAPPPAALPARVVGVHAPRVYVAAAESLALAPGDRMRFRLHGRTLATGAVTRVEDGEWAVARLDSGSLAHVRLARVELLAERPPLPPRPLLRVGCPSAARPDPLLACAAPVLQPPAAGAWRSETLAGGALRLVRTDGAAAAPWPDTLLVRGFDDGADEEIALERGELDAAVFWPGELSARMRDDPRWRGFGYGTRARGVVAALHAAGGPAAGPGADRGALDRALFRGDLAPWEGAAADTAAAAATTGFRYDVDPACPARPRLERLLAAAAPARTGAPAARLLTLDAPADDPDSLALAAAAYVAASAFPGAERARAGALAMALRGGAAGGDEAARARALEDSLRVTLLFRLRCPVVAAPALRSYLAALGLDRLVDLLGCAPGRRP